MTYHGRKHDRRSFLKIAGSAGAAGMAGLAGCTGGGDGGDGGGGGGGGDGGDGDGGGGGDGSDGGATPTPQMTTEKSEGKGAIKVALLVPLSGPVSGAGQGHANGAQLVVERLNAADGMGGYEVELVQKDTQASPDTAVKRARQVVQQEDADVITGIVSSAVAKALGPFTASQNVPLILTSAQTPDVTKSECQRTVFRSTSNIIHQEKAAAAAVAELTPEDATTVAGVNPDYVYGRQSWEFFVEEFSKLRPDAEYISEQWPAFLKGDYKKEVQATLDAEPDIVHSVLYSGDMIAFIKQANQFDFFDQVDHFFAGVTPMEVALPLGDQFPEGAISVVAAYYRWPGETPQQVLDFAAEYRDRFGGPPTLTALEQAAGIDALAGAVETAGGIGPDDVIGGLEGLTVEDTVAPSRTIRASDHQAILDFFVAGRMEPLPDEDFMGFTDPMRITRDRIADAEECTNF